MKESWIEWKLKREKSDERKMRQKKNRSQEKKRNKRQKQWDKKPREQSKMFRILILLLDIGQDIRWNKIK